MDSNEALRQRVLRLVTKHGISHKVMAGKMGMKPSTFSRWLRDKPGANPASVLARDGFEDYVHELRDDLDQPASQTERRQKSTRSEDIALSKRGHSGSSK